MKDLDLVIANPEQSVVYQQGVEFGAKAKDPFSFYVRPGDVSSYLKGYAVGLKRFIDGHGINLAGLGLWGISEALTGDHALHGYLRGLRRENPSVPRQYFSRVTKEITNDHINHRVGWGLGFAVGIARDFGVSLGAHEIPLDDLLYKALMAGLKAEPREWSLLAERELSINQKDDLFTDQLRVNKVMDEMAYIRGLGIWLKSEGITGVSTGAIRHPEALRAFKAAYWGQRLPEYDESSSLLKALAKGRIGTDKGIRYREYQNNKKGSFEDPSSPVEVARDVVRILGRIGDQLGLAARLAKAKQTPTK